MKPLATVCNWYLLILLCKNIREEFFFQKMVVKNRIYFNRE